MPVSTYDSLWKCGFSPSFEKGGQGRDRTSGFRSIENGQVSGVWKTFVKNYPVVNASGPAVPGLLSMNHGRVPLDEPLSRMTKLRTGMQYRGAWIATTLGRTFVFVPDQEEARLPWVTGSLSWWKEITSIWYTVISTWWTDQPLCSDFYRESILDDAWWTTDLSSMENALKPSMGGMRQMNQLIVIRLKTPHPSWRQASSEGGRNFSVVCIIDHRYDDLGSKWMIHSTRKAIVGGSYRVGFEPEDIHVMRLNETEEFDARIEEYVDGRARSWFWLMPLGGKRWRKQPLIYLSSYFLWIFSFMWLL